jgi:hypothetical protein
MASVAPFIASVAPFMASVAPFMASAAPSRASVAPSIARLVPPRLAWSLKGARGGAPPARAQLFFFSGSVLFAARVAAAARALLRM